jgi:transcriptional regulator with XRE-family HTH domain
MLIIGERLRTIRESKNLSQGDIEQRTGIMRCYTSRVKNGHTVPSIETLAKTGARHTALSNFLRWFYSAVVLTVRVPARSARSFIRAKKTGTRIST